jgi:serine kinase of HPr protein (carbohydrate metabolism regulator)
MKPARQATCVAIGGRGLLIEGPPGIGKSSLALALIDRGAMLIGDDGVLLDAREGRLFASPHPQTRGLLEVRNLGLLHFPVQDETPVALLIHLDQAALRYVEGPEMFEIAGANLPMIAIWPDAMAPLKARLALERFGLP